MMTDDELTSLVGAVRALMDQRDTAQRAIVENLKGAIPVALRHAPSTRSVRALGREPPAYYALG
jgi:hypothetical protein